MLRSVACKCARAGTLSSVPFSDALGHENGAQLLLKSFTLEAGSIAAAASCCTFPCRVVVPSVVVVVVESRSFIITRRRLHRFASAFEGKGAKRKIKKSPFNNKGKRAQAGRFPLCSHLGSVPSVDALNNVEEQNRHFQARERSHRGQVQGRNRIPL